PRPPCPPRFPYTTLFRSTAEELKQIVITALEDLKGQDIIALDVQKLTNVTDYMVFCSGTSNRQVKSLADNAQFEAKKRGAKILGSEGELEGEWVLVDLGRSEERRVGKECRWR